MRIIKTIILAIVLAIPVFGWAGIYLNGVGQTENAILVRGRTTIDGVEDSRGNTFLNGVLRKVTVPDGAITFGVTSLEFGTEQITF